MNTIEYLRKGDEIPYAGELPEVTVRPRKIVNKAWDKVYERWVGDMPTYYGVNPDTGKEEMLREIGNGKYSTYDDKHVFDVLAAKEAKKQKEQWVRNGGAAGDIDKVMLGTIGLPAAMLAAPEIYAGLMTPVGQTLLAGTLGGEAWEALNHGITGQSWGDNLGDVIGLDKNNYLGRTALGLANPFYGLSPNMVYRGGKAVLDAGKTALNLAQNTTSKSIETLQNKYPALFDQEMLARGKGIIDAAKYGIYDRVLGYGLYNKYLKHRANSIGDLLLNKGNIMFEDKSGTLFLLPTTYTRSEILYSGPTSMRMGFTPNKAGTKLSKDLVTQGKASIDQLPAGTIISADAHGISIPSRLSTHKGQSNVTKTLLEGTEDAETTLSRMERKFGEPFYRNPYDMSADAHRFFTLEAQKPGRELVYAGRSGKWNNAAVSNPEIYLWLLAYENGTLSARDYVSNYNNWVKGFGGRPGHVDIHGKPYFYHPTIFITHKQGGKMNTTLFLQGGNKIRKGEDGLKNFLGNSTTNSFETRNVSDYNLGRLYDDLSKSKIPMNHTTREQFITRSKDVINAINKHFSGPEIPRVFRNALLTVALEETGLNPSNLYLYGIIGGLRNLYLQKFEGRKDADSITHFIKKYFKGEYKNLGYSPKAIPSNVTDPREILTYYMTNLGDPSFFKRKNKGNTVAWKKWNEWLPIILNSNLIALNDSSFENNKNLFNTFNNEPENNLNNIFNKPENDSYNIVNPNDLLKKLNKQSGNVMLSKNGNKLIVLIPKGKTGIHIKKKNRGKFTDYCGGKVTDSCIRRAKASGNPTLVKRATFAANARKWKH